MSSYNSCKYSGFDSSTWIASLANIWANKFGLSLICWPMFQCPKHFFFQNQFFYVIIICNFAIVNIWNLSIWEGFKFIDLWHLKYFYQHVNMYLLVKLGLIEVPTVIFAKSKSHGNNNDFMQMVYFLRCLIMYQLQCWSLCRRYIAQTGCLNW